MKTKQPTPSPLCLAIKTIRLMYGDSQEQFGHRLSISSMTVSRFECGRAIPRNPLILQKFSNAARDANLPEEANLFMDAIQKSQVPKVFPPNKIDIVSLEASMKPSTHQKDMLTPKEIAQETGIGVNAVYLLLKKRHLPSISIGDTFLVPRPQYQHWLETVQGTFDGPSVRNGRKNPHADAELQVNSNRKRYWASMTAEQRSQEMRRRFAGRKGRKRTTATETHEAT